ncbi:MAG: hypothetical protein ACRDBL_07880 [Rhabdaerophilum sp.]
MLVIALNQVESQCALWKTRCAPSPISAEKSESAEISTISVESAPDGTDLRAALTSEIPAFSLACIAIAETSIPSCEPGAHLTLQKIKFRQKLREIGELACYRISLW